MGYGSDLGLGYSTYLKGPRSPLYRALDPHCLGPLKDFNILIKINRNYKGPIQWGSRALYILQSNTLDPHCRFPLYTYASGPGPGRW